jgi:hypothetical protein
MHGAAPQRDCAGWVKVRLRRSALGQEMMNEKT